MMRSDYGKTLPFYYESAKTIGYACSDEDDRVTDTHAGLERSGGGAEPAAARSSRSGDEDVRAHRSRV